MAFSLISFVVLEFNALLPISENIKASSPLVSLRLSSSLLGGCLVLEFQTLTNDKQFAALQLPPKAPTSNNDKRNVTECHEILFHARNVMKTDENTLLCCFMRMNKFSKCRQANWLYSARYRLRKQARLQNLKNLAESHEAEVSMNQSQLHFWKTARDELVEENAMMKAQYDIASKLVAEKEDYHV
ncbi:hypothetical protein GmHk_01G001743 [Glycine max]|nr:hypothetical protein GmHk_01G001743 [Glycine max]